MSVARAERLRVVSSGSGLSPPPPLVCLGRAFLGSGSVKYVPGPGGVVGGPVVGGMACASVPHQAIVLIAPSGKSRNWNCSQTLSECSPGG